MSVNVVGRISVLNWSGLSPHFACRHRTAVAAHLSLSSQLPRRTSERDVEAGSCSGESHQNQAIGAFEKLRKQREANMAMKGTYNVRSALARAVQLTRPVSTQQARSQALKANADTTKLSNAEVEQLGAARKPPGSDPGSFMHQQSDLGTGKNKFFQPWLLPIYPMGVMVAIGVGLGIMTAYRELAVNPSVLLDKNKRVDQVVELDDEAWTLQQSKKYSHQSPLRMLGKDHKISPFGRHLDEDTEISTAEAAGKKAMALMHQPPVLPGDDTSVHGPAGAKPIHGTPLGGGQ